MSNIATKLSALTMDTKELKQRFDASEHGGAPLLGISKPVIKAHGSSNAKAFKNAIRQAIAYSDTDFASQLEESLSSLAAKKSAQASESEEK